jgi:hypothetical protein
LGLRIWSHIIGRWHSWIWHRHAWITHRLGWHHLRHRHWDVLEHWLRHWYRGRHSSRFV